MTSICEFFLWRSEHLFNIDFASYSLSHHHFSRHFHDHYVIELVVSGVDNFYCSGKNYTAGNNQLVLVNPGEVHTGNTVSDTPLQYYSLYPDKKALKQVAALSGLSLPGDFCFRRSILDQSSLAQKFRLLFDSFNTKQDTLHQQEIFFECMNELLQPVNHHTGPPVPGQPKDRRIQWLIDFIRAHYKEDISLKQLAELGSGKNVLLIGIRNNPQYWYDSFNLKLYRYYPVFKKTVYFSYADSLQILEEALKEKDRPVVLFNLVNNGAAELAEWLTRKGVRDASYLVGGVNLFYEYASNKQTPAKPDNLFAMQSSIRFITPLIYCGMAVSKNVQLIDIRHDSLFNKINDGVKHDYKHLKNAVNFFAGKGARLFEQEFPDRKKEYVFISDSVDGLVLADALTKMGYKVSWMTGGLDRWEWYMNNVEDFKCNDSLVE